MRLALAEKLQRWQRSLDSAHQVRAWFDRRDTRTDQLEFASETGIEDVQIPAIGQDGLYSDTTARTTQHVAECESVTAIPAADKQAMSVS
jgi:hypothetical protein